jgi:hypothetical protein
MLTFSRLVPLISQIRTYAVTINTNVPADKVAVDAGVSTTLKPLVVLPVTVAMRPAMAAR